MTIKVEAWQSNGIKTNKCVTVFEFCCWDDLKKWINNPHLILHKCPECENLGVKKC